MARLSVRAALRLGAQLGLVSSALGASAGEATGAICSNVGAGECRVPLGGGGVSLLQLRPGGTVSRQEAGSTAAKLEALQASAEEVPCHTAVPGESCHNGVTWAMETGIGRHPEWYPGLSATSSFEEFQAVLHTGGHSECPAPCAPCHTAAPGEACHTGVTWAMETGIRQSPEWYPGLNAASSFEAFQRILHAGGHSDCPAPCAAASGAPSAPSAPSTPAQPQQPAPPAGRGGWHPTGQRVGGAGRWCNVGVPPSDWALTSCNSTGQPVRVKVLAYNLFWWNLFGRRHGNHGSAGKLIRRNHDLGAYDFMALQEADDPARVLRDAGLQGQYGIHAGGGMGWLYKKSLWRVVDHGFEHVGEDRREQWYGKRSLQWGRVQHVQTGRTVFLGNHHGPLPVNTGGLCGGRATALNIVRVVAQKSRPGDAIILAGDFNSNARSSEVKELDKHLVRVFTGTAIGGIDHFYSNCGMNQVRGAQKLGRGGSDHDAIEAIFEI